jgi:hypothetical protein
MSDAELYTFFERNDEKCHEDQKAGGQSLTQTRPFLPVL